MDPAPQLRDAVSGIVVSIRERARAAGTPTAGLEEDPDGEPATGGHPGDDEVPSRDADGRAGRLLTSFVATLAHLHQWLLLAGAVAALIVAGQWADGPADPAETETEAARAIASVAGHRLPGSSAGQRASATPPSLAAPHEDAATTASTSGLADEAVRESGPGPGDDRPADAGDADPAGQRLAGNVPDVVAGTGVPADGTISIGSTPPGARVLVDDVPVPGQTPTRVTLRDGARIRLEAPGFEPLDTIFREAGSRPTRLSYRLTPLPSDLERVRAPADVPYPDKTRHVEPALPAAASGEAAGGIVIVTLEIDAGGNVVDSTVLRGVDPSLDRAVLDAAWRWRFEPTVFDGRPVHVVANFTVPVGRD